MKIAPFAVALLLSTPCLAAEPSSIKVYPEHVGVFTSVGEQQFVALGGYPDGSTVNITELCDWYIINETNPGAVTISPTGLATVHDTYGQGCVAACYPKPCTVEGAVPAIVDTPLLQPLYKLLLDEIVDTTPPTVEIPEPITEQVAKVEASMVEVITKTVTENPKETAAAGGGLAGLAGLAEWFRRRKKK